MNAMSNKILEMQLGVWQRLAIVVLFLWVSVGGYHNYISIGDEIYSNAQSQYDKCVSESRGKILGRSDNGLVYEKSEDVRGCGAKRESYLDSTRLKQLYDAFFDTVYPIATLLLVLITARWVLAGRKAAV